MKKRMNARKDLSFFLTLTFLLIFFIFFIFLLWQIRGAGISGNVIAGISGNVVSEISDCTRSFQSGYGYVLMSDVNAKNAKTCFDVRVDNIEIDCQGKTITNTNSNSFGIISRAKNTTIKNCVIITNETSGIGIKFNVSGVDGYVIDNTIKDNMYGIYYESLTGTISGNTFVNNAIKDIFLSSLSGFNFSKNSFSNFQFPIDTCMNITSNGKFYLTKNLNAAGKARECLNVFASDAEIDCRGKTITNTNSNSFGIISLASNTTIKNCIIVTNATSGKSIYFGADASEGLIFNNTIKNTSFGIYFENGADENIVSGNKFAYNLKNIVREDEVTGIVFLDNIFGSGPNLYFKFDDDDFADSVNPGSAGIPVPSNEPPRIYRYPKISADDSYVLFNGANYINVSNFGNLISNNNPISISFWAVVNYSDLIMSEDFALFRVNVAGSDKSQAFAAQIPLVDENFYWDYGNTSRDGRLVFNYGPYFGKMTHIVLVSDGINGKFKGIYVNGSLLVFEENSSAPNKILKDLAIGCLPDYITDADEIKSYCYSGILDDFMVYNRTLEAEEIEQIYNSQMYKLDAFNEYKEQIVYSGIKNTYWVTVDQLFEGYSKNLSVGDEFRLNASGKIFYLTLRAVNSSRAFFNVNHSSKNLSLSIGQSAKLDVNSDGYYDLLVRYDKFYSANNASIYVKLISELISSGKSGGSVSTRDDSALTDVKKDPSVDILSNSNEGEDTKKLPSYIPIIILSILVLMIIILAVWIIYEIMKGRTPKENFDLSFPIANARPAPKSNGDLFKNR